MQSFSIWRGEPEAHTGGAPRGCRYRLASCASSQGIPLHSPPPTPCRIQYLGQLPSMCCHMWLDCSRLYNEMLTWCCASLQIILPHPVIRTSGLQTRGCSYPSGSILPRYPSRAITPSLKCSLPYASRPFGGCIRHRHIKIQPDDFQLLSILKAISRVFLSDSYTCTLSITCEGSDNRLGSPLSAC